MAINSVNKRRAAASFFLFVIAPIPDGTLDADDRSHIAGRYREFGEAPAAGRSYSQQDLSLRIGIGM